MTKPTLNVFGKKPENAVIVPEIPLSARNNCQSGTWTINDKEYGAKLQATIIKFSTFFGSLGLTQNTVWGQIWFIAEGDSSLPKDVVMVTYIKGRSLRDFNRIIAEVQSENKEPAEGIFIPEFVKHSGQKPDANGTPKPTNYYSLRWHWKEREDWSAVERAAAVLAEPSNQSRLVDLDGTWDMQCLDNLTTEQINQIVNSFAGSQEDYVEEKIPM